MSEIILEETNHFVLDEKFSKNAKIKVVGVGGAGGNALNRMREMDISDVEFIAVNTDAKALDCSLADTKILIGKETTKSLGAGARPQVGRQAVMENRDEIKAKIEGSDMIFIAAGMGGGTGTGAAPVIAEIAKELDILTVAIVSMPFRFEGPVRRRNALAGLADLRDRVDSIIALENSNILKIISKDTSSQAAFLAADGVLSNAVQSVCSIINNPGNINIDFRDIRTIMEKGGNTIMGTGVGEGENRAMIAAEAAIKCPLLGDMDIKGCSSILVNICHGENFTMAELDIAMGYIYEATGNEDEVEVIWGDCPQKELGEKVSITVIATGFDKPETHAEPVTHGTKTEQSTVQTTPNTGRVEQSIGRSTTSFTQLMRDTGKINTAEVLTAPVRNDVPEVDPVRDTIAVNAVAQNQNSPTGFHNMNLDVRQGNCPEEVVSSAPTLEQIKIQDGTTEMPAQPSSYSDSKESSKGYNSNEGSDWPSNFDAMPDLRKDFLEDDFN